MNWWLIIGVIAGDLAVTRFWPWDYLGRCKCSECHAARALERWDKDA